MFLTNWLRPRSAKNPNQSAPQPRTQLAMERLEDRSVPSAGALDPTFGSGGIVNPPAFGVNAMAIQTNGKIVTAGTVYSSSSTADDFALARYNSDGSLDSTFGTGGKVVTNVQKNQSRDVARAVAIQQDGKILAAGFSSHTVKGGTTNWDMALVRYTANGSLDTTFGSGGIAITSFSNTSLERATALALQPDGKIVIAGTVEDGTQDFALVRYNANGSLDTSFGIGGRKRISIAGASVIFPPETGNVGVVVQSDGKIAVSGSVYSAPDTYRVALARVNGTNGSLDSTFGTGGTVVADLGESNSAVGGMALQGDGKIVVAGLSMNLSNGTGVDFALARFTNTGALDNTFDGDGVKSIDLGITPDHNEGGTALAIQGDGKIVVTGYTEGAFSPTSKSDFAMVRVNAADGSLDSTFGSGGIVVTAVTSGKDLPKAIALQTDGKIVLGGTALARYLPSSPQIGSFSASPNPTAGSPVTLTAANVQALNPGSTITQVAFYADSNGDGQLDAADTLLGYGTQTSPGTWTFTFTFSTSGTYKLFAQAKDSYGVLSDPLSLDLEVL